MLRSRPLGRRTPLRSSGKLGPAPRRAFANCLMCGAPIEPGRDNGYAKPQQFCSQACMGAHKRRRVDLTCATCSTTFQRVAAWVRGDGPFYCSRTCQGAARVRPESTHSRGPGWRRRAQEIRDRDGDRCVRCSAPGEPRRKLSVDHVIPWVLVKNDANGNHDDNLASLCVSCHGVKTSAIEPRMLRGDWLALSEFYGQARAAAAMKIVL